MQVLVLGPVTVVDHGATHGLEVPRHRAVLTALALRAGRPVQTDELVDAVWGERPPASAEKTLQGYVSALRKQFGDDVIETVPGGYRLGPAVDAVDADDFERLVGDGRRLLDAGELERSRRALTRALALWRGEPASDLAPDSVRDGHRARLHELRILAHEARADAELGLGHHREIVPDLEQLVVDHPFREALWRALALAHHRSGNSGAALETFGRLRTVLADELGIPPSPESELLERRILDRDPELDLREPGPGNLPVPLDTFVGRTTEQLRLAEAIGGHRLVTVVGIGGVGKSRLANEVARRMGPELTGGAWWVDLAAIPPGGSVPGHVLAAMSVAVQTTSPPEAVLLARLRRAPVLMILDNCEHERERVAAFVEWVTAHDTGVRVLATSRVPLGVPGEQLVRVRPLPIGDERSDGARLFVERVAERGHDATPAPADVVAIVAATGGLPLGIELAAAQTGVLGADEIALRLRGHPELLALSAGDDDRHPNLGHVLEDTIGVLPADAAVLLPRLAVFPGDFGLDAATAVLGLDPAGTETTMAVYLDASLLSAVPGSTGAVRFRLLWPIRQLLLDRGDPVLLDDASRCYASYFRGVAHAFVDVADGPEEHLWLARAALDDHNLRRALGWWQDHDPSAALEFGPGLGRSWQIRGDQAEGRDTLRRLLTRAPDASGLLIAATELELSFLELLAGDVTAAFEVAQDAIARFESLGDARWLGRALRAQAHALHLGGMPDEVTTPLYRRALDIARDAKLSFSQAMTEVQFAHASGAFEQFDRVGPMLDHAEAVLRRHGDHGALAHAGLGRAFVAYGQRDAAACRRVGEEMLRQAQLAGDVIWVQIASVVLGLTWHELGDDARSRTFFHDAVHLAADSANTAQLGIALHALAATTAGSQPAPAARLWGAAGTLSPIWPLHARRYGEHLDRARTALGDRFDAECAAGAELTVDEAVALADTLT